MLASKKGCGGRTVKRGTASKVMQGQHPTSESRIMTLATAHPESDERNMISDVQ